MKFHKLFTIAVSLRHLDWEPRHSFVNLMLHSISIFQLAALVVFIVHLGVFDSIQLPVHLSLYIFLSFFKKFPLS